MWPSADRTNNNCARAEAAAAPQATERAMGSRRAVRRKVVQQRLRTEVEDGVAGSVAAKRTVDPRGDLRVFVD